MGKNQRKWRNILLDRNFQLSFTLLLVGVAAALMMLLGFWVKDVAYESTLVGRNQLEPQCADLEDAVTNPAPAVNPGPMMPVAPDDADDEGDGDEARDNDESTDASGEGASGAAAGDPGSAPADGAGETERPRTKVVIEETHMELAAPVVPVADPNLVADLANCKKLKASKVDELWSSYRLILIVLFGVGGLLVSGLAIYGLRMTHKVAGPLFKVGLYLDKLKSGVYDQVWNLRKGDQLMEFYEHFRAAHGELTHMQVDDIAALTAFLDAADAAKLGDVSPEMKSALAELKELLAEKNKGLVIPEDKRG